MKIKRAYFANGIEKAVEELSSEIIRFTRGTGAEGGVVGLSGGVDSTCVAYLCKYAFDHEKRDGRNKLKLVGAIIPSKANSPADEKDGLRVADDLGIERFVISVEPLAECFTKYLPIINNNFDKGNLYAELRAVVLSRIAASQNLRVMGTGNHDEDYVLGYFTKRGDGAVDNNILGNLPKRLVREVANYLGAPKDLVFRVSTAGLWEGQTDEGEIGYSYEKAELIHNGLEEGYTPQEVQKITGCEMKIIEDVILRHKMNEHKRKVPPVGKLNFCYRE